MENALTLGKILDPAGPNEPSDYAETLRQELRPLWRRVIRQRT